MNTICFDLYGPGAPRAAGEDATADPQAVFEQFLRAGDCGTEVLDPAAFSVRQVGDDVVGFVPIPSESLDRPASGSPGRLDDADMAVLAGAAQQRIDMLLERGIDQIVAITDIGLDNDLALARRLSDIDAIVGRASRSLLGDFGDVGLDAVGPYPQEVVNINAELVCVGHAWHNAWLVGELTVTFDGLGGVEACGGSAHLLLADGPAAVDEDPDVVTAVDSYARSLEPLSQESIGTAVERICRTGIPGRAVGLVCTPDGGAGSVRPEDMQQLLGHAMLEATGAEIAIMNAAVAADGLPAGPITIDEIYRALPYGHTLTYLEMTGAEIEATLEDGTRTALGPGGRASAFPHGVGVRWIADVSGRLDCRVEGLEIRLPGVAAWQPIDPSATYVVVTTEYLAGGGDGYRTMAAVSADGRATTTGIGDATAFIDYVTGESDGVVIPGLTEPKVADGAAAGS